MRKIVLVVLIVLGACSPRAELAGGALPDARVIPVFVGSTRVPDPATGDFADVGRNETLTLGRYDVAIPPEHRPGTLTVPTPGKTPDPRKDFLLAGSRIYPGPAAFRADLARRIAANHGEAVVFVHGYNTNFAEGLYRFAQMSADFGLPGATVHYAWPSRAQVMGYAYDQDSALFARDGLTALLRMVRDAGARRIVLVGHSMGGFLTMEALRQLSIAGDRTTLDRIGAVILISPDIDTELFRIEAHRIGRLPQPFIVFTSQSDKALNISAHMRGESARLGNLRDISRLADLKVTLIDTARFDTQGGHFNVANSPELIRLLRNWSGLARVLAGEQASHRDPFASVVLSVQNATQIVLNPIEKIGTAIEAH
ncbi:alpha/beta hydrolase [Paenirhodobacter enshiensis]|uniref:alpha/beta hydrolase n=1 Tax=Paenirhodobacter enshiensis TaxID=1105367 RepID=UPI003FA28FBB